MFTSLSNDELDMLWETVISGAQKALRVHGLKSPGLIDEFDVILSELGDETDERYQEFQLRNNGAYDRP